MSALPGRVLIDLPNWLGDFVHALPAVAALRTANRGGQTAALLPGSHAPIARLLGLGVIERPARAGFGWARRALWRRFDVVLTARHSTRAKLLLAGTGAKVCLASRGRGASALGLGTFRVARARHQRHDLDGALARLGLPGAPASPFVLPLPDHLRRQGLRQRALLAEGPGLVAILPSTRVAGGKRYPIQRFAMVCRELGSLGIASVVVVGPGEEALAEPLVAAATTRMAPTAWPLDETAALLACCDAAVGNDSGLTHLAAAVGCPTVALFGPTDPMRTAPVGCATVLTAVRRGARDDGGLAGLEPARVARAVRTVLARPGSADAAARLVRPSGVAREAGQRYDSRQRVGR